MNSSSAVWHTTVVLCSSKPLRHVVLTARDRLATTTNTTTSRLFPGRDCPNCAESPKSFTIHSHLTPHGHTLPGSSSLIPASGCGQEPSVRLKETSSILPSGPTLLVMAKRNGCYSSKMTRKRGVTLVIVTRSGRLKSPKPSLSYSIYQG